MRSKMSCTPVTRVRLSRKEEAEEVSVTLVVVVSLELFTIDSRLQNEHFLVASLNRSQVYRFVICQNFITIGFKFNL